MGLIITAVIAVLLFWRSRRARENALERIASGEGRSPLYWTGMTLAMITLAVSMYMAHLRPSEIHPALWVLAIALFAATLVVRRMLQWRYPH